KRGARLQIARAPRHVATVLRPFAPEAGHLLAVVDHGDARRSELQRHRKVEQLEVTLELVESARDVVAGEKMREQMAAPYLVAFLQIPVERHRPPASLDESENAPSEADVAPCAACVGLAPSSEHDSIGAPHPPAREEA